MLFEGISEEGCQSPFVFLAHTVLRFDMPRTVDNPAGKVCAALLCQGYQFAILMDEDALVYSAMDKIKRPLSIIADGIARCVSQQICPMKQFPDQQPTRR